MDSKAGKHGRMRMTRVIALLVVAILAVGLPASALGQPDASAAKAKKHKRSSCRKKAKKSGVDKKRAKHKSSCKKKKKKKKKTTTPTPPAENPVVPPVTPTPAPSERRGELGRHDVLFGRRLRRRWDDRAAERWRREHRLRPLRPRRLRRPRTSAAARTPTPRSTPATNPSDAEASVDCLINQARVANGLAPYTLTNAALLQSSTFHANDSVHEQVLGHGQTRSRAMSIARRRRDRLTHSSRPTTRSTARILAAGYCNGGAARSFDDAEDTYAGSGTFATPRQAVTFWLNDPPHRATLLSTTYTEHRIAVVVGNPFQGGTDAGWGTFVEDLGMCVP